MPFPMSQARALPDPRCAWGRDESGTASVWGQGQCGDKDRAAPCLVNPPRSSDGHLGAYQNVRLYLEALIALAWSRCGTGSTAFSWWRVCGERRERGKEKGEHGEERGDGMRPSGTQQGQRMCHPPSSELPPSTYLAHSTLRIRWS